MTTEERFERLEGILDALASTVVAHDNQIEGLIKVAEKNSALLAETREAMAILDKRWQAYINTLPRN